MWRDYCNCLAEDVLHQARATAPSSEMCDEFRNLVLLHVEYCLRAGGSVDVSYCKT